MIKKEWLDTPPPIDEVRTLDNGAEFIPIGIVERLLDEYSEIEGVGSWGTSDFKFQIVKTGHVWLADASCLLLIDGEEPMQGAVTWQISSNDDNMDYSATALSFCIANAAKKKGIRFGRALNGRMDKGETSIPGTQAKVNVDADKKADAEFTELTKSLLGFAYREDASEYLATTDFRFSIEAKKLIEVLPLKNNL